jgi:hypothetical protein
MRVGIWARIELRQRSTSSRDKSLSIGGTMRLRDADTTTRTSPSVVVSTYMYMLQKCERAMT